MLLKKYLYVFFISMVPIVELRGAVPIGTANTDHLFLESSIENSGSSLCIE